LRRDIVAAMKLAVFAVALSVLHSPASAQREAEPIRLNATNPHYFLYQGKAIALVTSGEHYGSVINADFDFHKYLATLQADGLNYTRLFGGSYVEVPGKSFGIQRNPIAPLQGHLIAPWARSSEPGYAGGGKKFDLDRWDPEYFRRLHEFLGEAGRRGVIVEISLFSSQYGQVQWDVSPFNEANNVNHTDVTDWRKINTLDNGSALAYQERYVRKLVHEASAFPNVFFEIENEPWSDLGVLADVVNPYLAPPGRDQYPNSIDLPDKASLSWQARVAEWIASEEAGSPHRHMIAQNYSNFRLPVRVTIPGVSILNFHYAYAEAVTLNYGLGKAIAYDETGFLGRGDDAYRRQAWNFMMAGGSTFDGLDYSFSPGHEDGTDAEPNGPGGGSAALRKELGILARFMAKLPLVELAPDNHAVVHAWGVVTHVLSRPGGVYAMYLDGNGPCQITLRLPAGTYHGEWINTVTGAAIPVTNFKSDGSERALGAPDFTNGIALRLTRTLY
jgi:hypothetical protein